MAKGDERIKSIVERVIDDQDLVSEEGAVEIVEKALRKGRRFDIEHFQIICLSLLLAASFDVEPPIKDLA